MGKRIIANAVLASRAFSRLNHASGRAYFALGKLVSHINHNKFLGFNNYHIAPIGDIDPAALKQSAKLARTKFRDDERRLSHNDVLNFIAKSLGFRRGFAGYKKEYCERLVGFMNKHRLVRRADVLNRVKADAISKLRYRQIADRLFHSNKPLPKRIFVGGDAMDLLRTLAASKGFKVTNEYAHKRTHAPYRSDSLEPTDIKETDLPAQFLVHDGDVSYRLLDARISFNNLIGDQLCDMGAPNDDVVASLYNYDQEKERTLQAEGRIFRRILELYPAGWVEVIPYNSKLIFLKAPDGTYEFVFPGLRDQPFPHNPYAPYLRDKDYSKSEDVDAFRLHLYYHYDRWLEADEHDAEIAFYAGGGQAANHPGGDEILKAYLTSIAQYNPTNKRGPLRSGYELAQIGGRKICFSDLITNRQFQRFLEKNKDYEWHRNSRPDLDRLDTVHTEDPDLPASVTWYDAKAYARWMKRTNKLPVRLLTEDEYRALSADLVPRCVTNTQVIEAYAQQIGDFYDPDGKKVGPQPDYMPAEEFQRWQFRFAESSVNWATSEKGLKVIQSYWFGEWLNSRGAAINSLFFCGQYDVWTASIDEPLGASLCAFSPTSTGKYKAMKIGFRLAYDTDNEA